MNEKSPQSVLDYFANKIKIIAIDKNNIFYKHQDDDERTYSCENVLNLSKIDLSSKKFDLHIKEPPTL